MVASTVVLEATIVEAYSQVGSSSKSGELGFRRDSKAVDEGSPDMMGFREEEHGGQEIELGAVLRRGERKCN